MTLIHLRLSDKTYVQTILSMRSLTLKVATLGLSCLMSILTDYKYRDLFNTNPIL